MSTHSESIYQVNPDSDPVVLSIKGRASYLNSAPVSDFFNTMLKQGKERFLLDFMDCTGMDSTFLGILAGVALDVSKKTNGHFMLCRLGPRNMELVRNLGLDRISEIITDSELLKAGESRALGKNIPSDRENAEMILSAHENLCQIDEANKAKFQDVIAFLKTQIEQSDSSLG